MAGLSPLDRGRLLDHLELVLQFPFMYPSRQRGRYRGLRYFLFQRRWLVYYRVNADRGVVVLTIVPAMARPR
jgi:plasmid stabilization system protein ParE